jgi:opacity protein-like surface antigen
MSSDPKTAIATFVFVSVVGLSVKSNAAEGWYMSGNAGTSIFIDTDVTDKFSGGNANGSAEGDEGVFVSGAVGYSWGAFRLEGEAMYQKSDLDTLNVDNATAFGTTVTINTDLAMDADISSLGFMVNGWFDIDTGSKWTPFIGGGVGISRQNVDVNSIAGIAITYDQNDEVFSYQGGAGLRYAVTDNTSIGLSYRYFGSQDAKFDDGSDKVEARYTAHIVSLGFVHNF